ncbi:MAG: hypothetical protein LBC84_06760 [Prevotellaceae bacterium]|jgi:endonuclease V-like protein UPF0215 family|nr:hypothetical protein [Prevotellaceae bacterium]
MNKIQIDREMKIMLLKALKNGYFEVADLERLAALLRKPDLRSIEEKRAELSALLKQIRM